MSSQNSWWDTSKQITTALRKGDLDRCKKVVSDYLKKLPKSPFHLILDLEFSNPSKNIAKVFEKFIDENSKKYVVKAIYTETNGFDINPDRWYFDLFAYDSYGGHEDYDWLSGWKWEIGFKDYNITLKGMEPLQEVYASDSYYKKEFKNARDHCSLLFLVKFQILIRTTAPFISNLKCPLLASAHDYQLIYEYKPPI